MKSMLIAALLACTTISCAQKETVADRLVYCSYASEGKAALGTDYCELVADSGTAPYVHVVKNQDCHFAEMTEKRYDVADSVVTQLQAMLDKHPLKKVNGYRADSHITGGRSYRFHIEYASGRTIHASWYTHDVMPEADALYAAIEHFFRSWYIQTKTKDEISEQEEEPIAVSEDSATRKVLPRGNAIRPEK